MGAGTATWAIRSVPRRAIVDHFLIRHFGWTVLGGAEAEARDELEAALDGWIRLGLPFARGPSGEELFDPVEVTNFMVAAGMRDADDYWQRHHVATERRQVLQQARLAQGEGRPPRPEDIPPQRTGVRLERTYDLSRAQAGARARLRLPLPIEDDALRDLSLTIDAPPGAALRVEAGRADASLAALRAAPVMLAATARFEAHPGAADGAPLSEQERALYLAPSEGLIQATARVREEAGRIVATRPDGLDRLEALYFWLFENFTCGAVPYHALDMQRPTDWVFEAGVFDCQIGAALFCAMCRAVGIPARLCSGFQLYPPNYGYHYWAQAWVEGRGWLTFDYSAWHLSRGGHDRDWARVLAGWADRRMKVQVLPRLFTGFGSIGLPRCWHLLQRRVPGGLETSFVDAISGTLVYRDRVTTLGTGIGES